MAEQPSEQRLVLRAAITSGFFILAGAGGVGFAQTTLAQGDGSGTDNPDLLRGSLSTGCPAGTLCDFPPIDLTAPAPAPAVARAAPQPIVPQVSQSTTRAVVPAQPATMAAPLAGALHVEPRSEFEPEYSLALRGAYTRSGEEERFEVLAIPEISLSRAAAAIDLELGASATVVAPDTSDGRIGAARLGGTLEHRLSPGAGLVFDADLEFSQEAPNGLGAEDTDVAEAPWNLSGAIEAAYTQRLGHFDVTASAGVDNLWVGPTVLEDGTRQDNFEDSRLGYDGGLRVGYALTPIVSPFVSGRVGRQDYWADDPDLMAARSNAEYQLRGGISANWSDVVTFEASAGRAWRDYDAPAVSDSRIWVYGAALGFAPDSTTQLTARFDTTLDAGEGASASSAEYALDLEASRRVNPWLALRANASAQWTVPTDGAPTERRYGVGAGSDIAFGPHTSASLDYTYGWRNDNDPTTPDRNEHRVSGGLTLRY